MNRHGAVELLFGDGTYTFRLGLAEIEELEDKRDISIFTMADRMRPRDRTAKTADITQTLRLGLIGGGTSPVNALGLVAKYVDQRPIDESRDVAFAVILAALARVHPGELSAEAGEPEAAESTD